MGDEFDLLNEINEQLALIRGLRQRLTLRLEADPEGVETREYKDLIASSTALFSLLSKQMDALKTHKVIKGLENATFEAIRCLPRAEQDIFFAELERQLREHCPA